VKRALLDTNVYIDWLNRGDHEALVLAPDLVRYMSTVVLMELEVGATTIAARRAIAQLARVFVQTKRLVAPSQTVWRRAGAVFRGLRSRGREIRRASLVNDTLIALTARDAGATVFTRDGEDYEAIREVVDFSFVVVV
jgi:predicted nucleic acid-binding protein